MTLGVNRKEVGVKRKDHLPPKRKEEDRRKTRMEKRDKALARWIDAFGKVYDRNPSLFNDEAGTMVITNTEDLTTYGEDGMEYTLQVAPWEKEDTKPETHDSKWTKCEDELPAEMEWVQFTRKDPVHGRAVSCGSFIRSEVTGEKFIDANDDKFTPIEEVIAWKYLDAPYEGD